MGKIRQTGSVIKNAFKLFVKNDPLRMSGATAFFTMFALPPILIILVQLFSLVVDERTIREGVFASLTEVLGEEAVEQVVSVIIAVNKLAHNWPATIAGFVFLMFVATTLFKVVRSSISQIWNIPVQRHKKLLRSLQSRIKSLVVIVFTGLLFSSGLLIETLQVIVGDYFFKLFPSLSGLFNRLVGFAVSTLLIGAWCLIIFRFLTICRPHWNIAWRGALFTGFLISLGKSILHVLLTYSTLNNIYGASASVVLLLLFVFYSAMILYFGASFTKVLGEYKGTDIGFVEPGDD